MLLRWAWVLLVLGAGTTVHAQTMAAPYAGTYNLQNLGGVPGLPSPYGGLCFLNNNTILIGGSANQAAGAIYQINVVRNASNQITGFSGTATLYKNAANIDGGLTFGTGGVLFATAYPINQLHQYKPGGGINPDKTIDLTAAGVTSSSVGSVQFVPPGFPGAGGIRILSWSAGGFYTANLTPDGNGTFDLSAVTLQTTITGGPEGIVYVPIGSPVFNPANRYALISEYSAGRVSVYQLDASGYPMPASRADFVTSLTGAEGAVLDPLTNDFLFSTFGGSDRVIRVSGFALPGGVLVTQSGGTTDVAEGGATDTYSIVLSTAPTANVTITINPGTQVNVAPSTLTFTSTNWNVAQTVTVTAVDDVLSEGAHTGTITHTAASTDASYNGIAITSVIANITDNDGTPPIPPPTGGGGGPEGSYSGTGNPSGSEGGFGGGGRSGRGPTLLGPLLQQPGGGMVPASVSAGPVLSSGTNLTVLNVAHRARALTPGPRGLQKTTRQPEPGATGLAAVAVFMLASAFVAGRRLIS
jgi:hypothetical protein